MTKCHLKHLPCSVQVKPDNTASLALLRTCGFTEEGLLRSWLWIEDEVFDAIQFSLLRSDLT